MESTDLKAIDKELDKLSKNRSYAGRFRKQFTDETWNTFLTILQLVAKRPVQLRPKWRELAVLIESKTGVKPSDTTIRNHFAKIEEAKAAKHRAPNPKARGKRAAK